MRPQDKARLIRPLIEKAAQSLTDAEALSGIELYPSWSGESIVYKVGTRVRYNDILYTVLQEHTSQESWTPDTATSLFARVLIPDPTIIPDWEQPDSTNPYMTGDKVRFNGRIYESVIDNNIWSPEAYPAGWKDITDEN